MVLGPSALEEPSRVSWWRRVTPRTTSALLVGLGTILSPGLAAGVGEDPGAEVAEALRTLGPPGVLWGRFVVEEESPVGGWTPVNGVEVTAYPATPTLVAELERIRQSARASGAQYESAVARVQAALAAHQARVDGKSPDTWGSDGALMAEPPILPAPRPAAPKTSILTERSVPERPGTATATAERPGDAPPHPWRQSTDPAGLFAFESLPSGDWLVVAMRISAYTGQKLRAAPRQQPGSGRGFLARATGPAREAEIWVTKVRVGAAERVGLELTDRARWLAGPMRPITGPVNP
jgi:hypothetical protein